MEENGVKKKWKRKVKENKSIFRYSVNLNEEENKVFLSSMEKSGIKKRSKFIASRILNEEVTILYIDRRSHEYYMRLTELYYEYKRVGVNYNQVVKSLNTNFGEKKTRYLMYNLEKFTLELISVYKQVIELTNEFRKK